MKSTTKLQVSILGLSAVIAVALFAVFALAPSIIWASDSDWSGGTFTNTTSINGGLMLNNTIVNGTIAIYSWFYSNWTYRKAIIINGSTSLLNDYQVMINLTNRTAGTDNFNFARALSDGNDTRFTWLNASSGLEQNVSFWIENWTASSSLGNATLWVKVPNVTASSVANTTLYMYYGNPSATYNNSLGGNNTFGFFDDFVGSGIDTSIWTKTIDAGWSVSGGLLKSTDSTGKITSIATLSSPLIAETKMNIISTADQGGVMPIGFKNGISDSFAYFHDQNHSDDKYILNAWLGGVFTSGTRAPASTWLLFRITSDSSGSASISSRNYDNETIYRNEYVTKTITNLPFVINRRYDDVFTSKVQENYWDWFRVRKYASPSPEVLSVGSEQMVVSKGTYLSNTTTTSGAIASITVIINKTEYNYNGAINLTNLTVDISANAGTSWCGNVANNTAYTSANGCGGIGSGTQLKYRINFSTNDTSKTAVLSDINLSYVIVIQQWSANSTKLSSPQTYNPGITYGFQINWSSSGNIFANATFQLGSSNGGLTNYTNSSAIKTQYVSGDNYTSNARWYINFTQDQLGAAGTYNFTWFGNDISGTHNKSDTVSYVINQNSTNPISLYFRNSTGEFLNQNMTVTYGTQTNTTLMSVYPQAGTFNLYYNHTLNNTLNNTNIILAAGIYNVTANTTGNANYTSNSTSFLLTINIAPALVQLFFNGSESDRIIYSPNITNLTASVNMSGKIVAIDANFSGAIRQIANSSSTSGSIGNWTPAGESQNLWQYRKNITINGSTSLQNNYQILINLTNRTAASDNFNFARALSDGNDTRFTWLNASSGLEQNVSFWIENWTASSSLGNATLWVKVPNVTASSVANTTLYMYYGNPSAIYNNSLGRNNTFVFFDDFNRNDGSLGNNWAIVQGTASISGNKAMIGDTGSKDGAVHNPASGAVNGIAVSSDFYLIDQTEKYGGVMVRSSATGSLWTEYGYGWLLVNNLNLYIYDGATNVAGPVAFSITVNTWYNQEILAFSDNSMEVRIWQKGTARPSSPSISKSAFTPSANDGTGIRILGGGDLGVNHAYHDDVRVRKYASPEPNVLSVGAAENGVGIVTQINNTVTNFTNLSNLAKGVYNITAYAIDMQNLTGTISQTWYLTVWGRLNISIDAPSSNAIFNRTYPYRLNATVRDDNGLVSGANVSWFASEALLNSSTSTYNYTWTVPASQAIGATTLKANASKNYYDVGENSTSVQVWRNITVNLTLSQQSIYRNNSYNPYNSSFLTYVSDESGAVSGVTVTYFRNGTQLQSRDTTSSGYADDPNNYTYNPADTTTPASYLIAANITSAHSNTYFTNNSGILTVNAFLNSTITQPGNGAYFHKNETMTLQSQTRDDNNNLVAPDSINWTLNNLQILSAETGSYEIPWNRSSGSGFPLNITSSKQFYGTSTHQITIEIWGWLISINNPANSTLIHKTDTLSLNSTVSDEKFPNSIVNYNVSWRINNTEIAGGNVTSWIVPNSQVLGYYNLDANTTNATYQVGNSTGIYIFGWSNATSLTGIGTYPAGTIAEITCSVRDANSSAAVANYPVSFWKNTSLQTTNLTNSTGTARWFWDTASDNNPYDIKCNITDNSTLYYNVSFPELNATSNVTKILNLVQINVDNATIYRKDNCAGCSPFAANLTVHITEAQLGNSNGANVTAYNSTHMIGECLTNSTGWCALTYNPWSTITPDNYTFWINATKSGFQNSTTNLTWVAVKGKLNSWIDDPFGGEKWYRTQSVNLYSTVQDENSAAVSATVEWQNSTGNALATGGDTSWQISTGYPLGQAQLRVNATKQYYDNYTSPSATVEIYGWSNVSWLSPAGVQTYGNTLALNCSVRDANNSALISGFNVSFYRNNTFIGSNFTSGGYSVAYWNPTIADYAVRCNIINNATLYYDTSISQTSQTISVRDLTKPYIRNTSMLYTSMEVGQNQTITANVTDDVAIDKVWVAFDIPPQNDSDVATYINLTLSLADGNSTVAYYELNYTPQKGGIYNATVFANDTAGNINSSFTGNFSVPKNTTGYMSQISYEIIDDINSTYNRSLSFNATLVNTGNTSMSTASITVTLPGGWSSANLTLTCGSVAKFTNCTQIFNASVPAGTAPANYTISAEGKWRNPDNTLAYFGNYPTNQTVVNVTSNPMLNITANNFSGTAGHGNESTIGAFVLQAIGNVLLDKIYFNKTSGNLSANWVEFETAGTAYVNYLPSLAANQTKNINVNVTVPATERGYYTAGFVANATNTTCGANCWKYLNVSITIPDDWSWAVSPASQTNVAYQNVTGNLTNMTIANSGNMKINFTISASGNASALIAVSDSSVMVENQTSYSIQINYSIPLAQQFGIYQANITIANNSASPAHLNATVTLDVRDNILPKANNTNLSSASIEANYHYLNITADAFDNLAVSAVWANITLPNSTRTIIMMGNISANTYRANYTPSIAGVHNVTVFVNDTAGNINSTSAGNFTAVGVATGFNKQEPTSVTASNITQASKYPFIMNATLNNTETGTMRFVNFTLTVPSGFEANATSAQCSNLSSAQTCLHYFAINVTAGASPSIPDITGNFTWQNPDYTIGYASNTTSVTVQSNPVLNISETNISGSAGHGNSSAIGTFTIMSEGNAQLSSVALSSSGNLSGWLSYNQTFPISSIAKGVNKTVLVTASVPLGQAAGTYIANIMLNATGSSCSGTLCWDNVTANLTVPQDWSWNVTPARTPSSGYQIVQVQTNGSFVITVNNTGNLKLNLSLTQSGNATDNLIKTPSPLSSAQVLVTKQNHTNITFTYDSSGMAGGNYTLDIKIVNSSASPTELHSYAYFEVKDLPPTLGSITVSPSTLDQNYQTVLIQADVVDNIAVDKVWANITKPSGTDIVTLNNPGGSSVYNVTYVPTQAGAYSVSIYANDTAGYQNNSALYSFTSVGSAIVSVILNVTQVSVSGVTQDSGASIPLNITFNNNGQGTAYFANLSFNLFAGWSASPTTINYNNLTGGSSRSNISTITISAGALGQYLINASATWSNPNNTIWTNRTVINITVLSNPQIDVVESIINITAKHSTSNSTNFTINATGNDALSSVAIACQSGAVCTNTTYFSYSFTPSSISSVPAGNSTNITVAATAALGVPPGIYVGVINASMNASGTLISDTVQIGVNVPGNSTWDMSQSWSNPTTVGTGSTGTIGTITVNNRGNQPLLFTANTSGNATTPSIMNLSQPNITVAGQSSGTFMFNYYAPSSIPDSVFTIYSINVSVANSTASPAQQSVLADLKVMKFNVRIFSPTSPTNVTAGDSVQINTNATYGDTILSTNITWSVAFNSTACPITVNTTSLDAYNNLYWRINCTAPQLADANNYTLTLTGNYTNYGAVTSDSKTNIIVYPDVSKPKFSAISAPSVTPGNNVTINASLTDNVAVLNVTAQITYPNSTSVNFTLANTSSNLSSASWVYNLSDTLQVGDYDIRVFAKDNENNWNTSDSWFEVYLNNISFGGTAESASYLMTFNLYRPGKTGALYLIHTASSNSSGGYDAQIHNRTYDAEFREYGNAVKLLSVPLTDSVSSPIRMKDVAVTKVGSNILRALAVSNNLSFGSANVTLNYSGSSGYTESALRVFKCANWSYTGDSCNTTWTSLGGNSNGDYTITANTTSFSAFAVSKNSFVCGDGVCDSANGETSANCATDGCSTTTPAPPGGTGGGGTGGGGGGTTAPPQQPQENLSALKQPDMEISSNNLEVTLYPGEYVITSVDVKNNLATPVSADMTVEGRIWEFVQFENASMTMEPKSINNIKIKFTASSTTLPGIYTGDIFIKTGNKTQRISTTMKVEERREALMDVKIETLTKEINPGQPVRSQVTLYNMGMTKKIDVTIGYTVKEVYTEKIVAKDSETLAIESSLSFVRTIALPKTISIGKYTIEAVAYYENKTATGVSSFDVVETPAIMLFLISIFTSWYPYAIVAAIIVLLLIRLLLRRMRERRAKNAKYIFPVDFKKLPKGIKVGKIAETDADAYLDPDKLTTHLLLAGGTGSGKSVTAMVIAEEVLKRGTPVIVFDPTAQWTGFIKPCRDDRMLVLYPRFGMKPEEAKAFKGTIVDVTDPKMSVDITKCLNKGEITVFNLNKMFSADLDSFVRKTIDNIFAVQWKEARELKVLIIYDEVHRLLPKYGGKGGYTSLERGAREFRKWGIGLIMISQVLLDFRGAVRAVIASEGQLRTKYEGDINRVKTKYGAEYAATIPKLQVGTILFQNPEYNDGKPWFISFRPLLHDTSRIPEEELQQYKTFGKKLEELEEMVSGLKAKKVETYDLEIELNIAKEKVKQGQMRMAQTYIDSIEARLKSMRKK